MDQKRESETECEAMMNDSEKNAVIISYDNSKRKVFIRRAPGTGTVITLLAGIWKIRKMPLDFSPIHDTLG